MSEGSIYEALNIIESQKIDNIKIHMNDNGYSAYRETKPLIPLTLMGNSTWYDTRVVCKPLPFLEGLDAHYHVMSQDDYQVALEVINGSS